LQTGEITRFDFIDEKSTPVLFGLPDWITIDALWNLKEAGVAGIAAQCLTYKMQVLCHTGYELPDKQMRDLELLQEKFSVRYPDGQ
jgi:hypothetical protein